MHEKIIPYSRQNIDYRDINSVQKVLKSDYLTTGPKIKNFEKLINKYCKCKYSVAVNSATSALHIACLSLNLNKNDFLWTSPISFVASANCGLYCGAKIDFVEIDLKTFNLSVQKLEQKLILAKKNNRLPKILVVVHLGGLSCNMHEIYKLSKKFGFKIIEDASHALGGSYRGFKVGSCKYSDITVFSFHPVKIITSGEGGVATTNNKKLADKMLMLREHGIIRDKSKFNGKSHGPWHYQQQYLGFNYRMSDIHAALGISQLKKINIFVKRRNEISKIYKKEFKNYPFEFQELNKNILSTFHLFIILVPKYIHLELFKYLRKNKIFVNLHYIPIFLHPYFSKRKKINMKNYSVSLDYYNRAISLPVFFGLNNKQLFKIINKIKIFFKDRNEKLF